MARLLASIFIIINFALGVESGLILGVWGGTNLNISKQTLDFYGTTLNNMLPTATSPNATPIGPYEQNGRLKESRFSVHYSAGLRAGYQNAITERQAIRGYLTFGTSSVSIGVNSRNAPYFKPQTFQLYQAGLAIDYIFEFLQTSFYGMGIYGGIGYEHSFGEFSKHPFAKNAQPYFNVGLTNTIGNSGFSLDIGAKIPFFPFFDGDSRIRDKRESGKKEALWYIYLSDTRGVEYTTYKDNLSARLFTFYLALNYVF